jgi:MULE transposase domain
VTDRCQAFLNAIDVVWPKIPSLVCRWHINKAVEARIRSQGGKYAQERIPGTNRWRDSDETTKLRDKFYAICDAGSVAEFTSLSEELHSRYPFMRPYLNKEWWPYKERFVRCYTNRYEHFGEVTTSRMEGMHSVLKAWIRSSNVDVWELYHRTREFWESQVMEYTYKMGLSNDRLRELNKEFFAGVNGVIHRYPLEIINKHLKLANSAILEAKKTGELPSLGNCNGNFTRVFGMPCKHQILDLLTSPDLRKQGLLWPRVFHQHWWIRRGDYKGPDLPPPLREPRVREKTVQNRQQSHRKGAGEGSTRRQFTRAEITDRNIITGTQIPPL